jgi:hypothetical protein
MTKEKLPKHQVDTDVDTYDRGIVPAETAARKEREGAEYKRVPQDDKPETRGYTVDKEGLANNFAIEPEMYVNEPGDLRKEHEEDIAERTEEFKEINEDREGQLTIESDKRGKGTGII